MGEIIQDEYEMSFAESFSKIAQDYWFGKISLEDYLKLEANIYPNTTEIIIRSAV